LRDHVDDFDDDLEDQDVSETVDENDVPVNEGHSFVYRCDAPIEATKRHLPDLPWTKVPLGKPFWRCTEEELDIYDRETERSQMIAQVRQIFINLDDQHMGDMDFEKYTQAYQWLAHNGATPPMHQLQKQFAAMDVSGSGLISEEQFLKSIISDMDVTQFTSKAQFDDLMEKLSDFDDHISDLVGGDVSQKLRDRLNQMKSDMDSKVGALFGKMAGLTGANVLDFISPEVLDKHLTDAFNKFDYTGDGRLSYKEFSEAWRDLGARRGGPGARRVAAGARGGAWHLGGGVPLIQALTTACLADPQHTRRQGG